MKFESLDSPLEARMEEGLKKRGIKYRTQEVIHDQPRYGRGRGFRYLADFVVFGKYCKIVVECDGKNHQHRKARDAVRDYYLITHGYADVLRFTGKEIYNELDKCLDRIESTIERMDNVYENQQNRMYLNAHTLSENPNPDQVQSILLEVVPLLLNAYQSHPASNKKFFLEFRKQLQKRFYSTEYEKLHFTFPSLVTLLQQGKIESFFSLYNIPFVLILGNHSIQDLSISSVRSVIHERKIIKVFFHSKENSTYLKEWIDLSPVHWVQIWPEGSVRSDLIGSLHLTTPQQKGKKRKSAPSEEEQWEAYLSQAQKLEQTILFRYKSNQGAKELEDSLRSLYRAMYQTNIGKSRRISLFTECTQEQRERLFKELQSHWNWIILKNTKPDAFQEALLWFKERGNEWREKSPVTIHDVTMYFHLLHRNQKKSKREEATPSKKQC